MQLIGRPLRRGWGGRRKRPVKVKPSQWEISKLEMGVGLKASQIWMYLEEKVEYSLSSSGLFTDWKNQAGTRPPEPQFHTNAPHSLTGIVWYRSNIGMSFELRYHLLICK